MPHRPTMADVARRAGVHKSTVSLALRGDLRVSPETRQAVEAAATALGYRVDPVVAQILSHRRLGLPSHFNQVIAYLNLLPPEFYERPGHFDRLWRGVEEQARRFDLKVERFDLGPARLSLTRLVSILEARAIRGLLIGPVLRPISHLRLPWDRYSAVFLGASEFRPRLNQCTIDFTEAMRSVFKNLRARGRQRIGLALSRADQRLVADRWAMAYEYFTLRAPVADRIPAFDIDRPLRDFSRWIEKNRPDAIVGYEHALTPRFKALGIEPGGEIALALLNASPNSAHPGVDTVPESVGAAGVDLLVNSLAYHHFGLSDLPRQVLVPPDWIEGAAA